MVGWFFPFCLRLRQSSFHWIISGIGKKWNRSDSSKSDSVELMTPLATPIFDFHYVGSAQLTTPTPTPTPTPSPVKTIYLIRTPFKLAMLNWMLLYKYFFVSVCLERLWTTLAMSVRCGAASAVTVKPNSRQAVFVRATI